MSVIGGEVSDTIASRLLSISRSRSFLVAFVVLAIAAGIALRLAFPRDIEFKLDEFWTFELVRRTLQEGQWFWTGMPMSTGGSNPGMSVWAFVALGWIFGADTPPALARGVQLLNCAALLALVAFTWRSVREDEREPWLWAAALWAVNPIAVVIERKIWPPSVLPIFTVGIIATWWHRRTVVGSLLFALLATLAGQIHLSAAFFALTLVVWSLLKDARSLRVGALVAGAALGFVPAIPWLMEWSRGSSPPLRLPILHFWQKLISQGFGFGTDYILGDHFMNFLAAPVIGVTPTYLVALLHAGLAALAAFLCWRAVVALRRRGTSIKDIVIGDATTGLLLRATLIGYGVLLTALSVFGADLHRHYMAVIVPVTTLFIARLAAFGDGGRLQTSGRLGLAGLTIVQPLVSAALLYYIHITGVIGPQYGSQFGTTWAVQQLGQPKQ